MFEKISDKNNISIDDIANLVHKAWISNYIFWRDNEPYIHNGYIKPFKPLADERRNLCVITEYELLPYEERQKDLIIAKWFQNKLNIKKINTLDRLYIFEHNLVHALVDYTQNIA